MQNKIYPFGPPCNPNMYPFREIENYIDYRLSKLDICSKSYIDNVLLSYIKVDEAEAYIDKKIEEATAGIESKVKEIVDAEVDDKIESASSVLRSYVDTSIKDLDSRIQATYCTSEYVGTLLQGYYTKEEVDSKIKLTFTDIII